METKAKFDEINSVEKFIFKLSILTICTIVGNIYLVLFILFAEGSVLLPNFIIVITIIVILILGGTIQKKLNLDYRSILSAGIFILLLFPNIWIGLQIGFPLNFEKYVELRKFDNEAQANMKNMNNYSNILYSKFKSDILKIYK